MSKYFNSRFIITISLMLFVILWFSFAQMGTRGTDQYWYLAAVKSIVELGKASSNTIFPSQAFQGPVIDNPFVHNVPQIYLASIFGLVFGSYWGWAVFNLICVLLSNYIAFLILRKYIPTEYAVLSMSLWLLFPINVWFSFQPNSEAFIAFLISIASYIYLVSMAERNFIIDKIKLLFIFVILIATRANFLLLIFIAPFLFLNSSKNKYRKIGLMGAAFIFMISGLIVNRILFPQQSLATIFDALLYYNNDAYYQPPMLGYYSIKYTHPDFILILKLLPLKIFNAIKTQFFRTEIPTLPFYLIFNVLVVFIIFVYWRIKNSILKRLTYLVSVMFIIHFATAVVFQNQVRYLYPYFTVLYVSGIIALYNLLHEKANKFNYYIRISILPVIIFFGIVIFTLFKKNLTETSLHKKFINRVKNELSVIPDSDNVWLERQSSIMSYILFPRDVLGTLNSFSDSDLLKMANNADVHWLIEPADAKLSNRMKSQGWQFQFVKEIDISLYDQNQNLQKVYKIKR